VEAQRNPTTNSERHSGHGEPAARQRSRVWVPIIAGVVTLIAISSTLYSLNRPSIPKEIDGLIAYGDIPSVVVDGPVGYSMDPPAGGQHAATSLECGLYFKPVENELAVAALATGAIWIAYNPSISDQNLEDLKLFGEGKIDILMAPYPDLPRPLIITAWGFQLYPDSPKDTRIASFIRDYKNADSAPYPDLSCRDAQQIP
jgi:Protein of unknown function (DUF3105)